MNVQDNLLAAFTQLTQFQLTTFTRVGDVGSLVVVHCGVVRGFGRGFGGHCSA